MSTVMLMLDAGVSAKACESLSVFCFPCQEWDCLDAARFFAERTNLQGIWLSVYVRRGIPGSEPIKTAGVLRWRWDRPWFLRAEARNLSSVARAIVERIQPSPATPAPELRAELLRGLDAIRARPMHDDVRFFLAVLEDPLAIGGPVSGGMPEPMRCACGVDRFMRFGPYEEAGHASATDLGLKYVYTCTGCGEQLRVYQTSPAWRRLHAPALEDPTEPETLDEPPPDSDSAPDLAPLLQRFVPAKEGDVFLPLTFRPGGLAEALAERRPYEHGNVMRADIEQGTSSLLPARRYPDGHVEVLDETQDIMAEAQFARQRLDEMLAHPDADPVGEGATLILHDDRGAAYTDHEIGSIECTPHAAIVKCGIEDTVQVSASKEGIELSSDTVMLTPGQAIELIGLLRRAIVTVAREQKALGPATDYRPAPAKPREGSS